MANLRWREEDQDTFDLDSELVGEKVFKPDNAPFRLYDMSHESKNLNGKVKDLVEKNGFKTLLGPRNRLHLTLFIQMTMKQFYKEQENPTPLLALFATLRLLGLAYNEARKSSHY